MESAQKCTDLKQLAEKSLIGPYEVRQKIAIAPHAARMLLKNGKLSASSTLDAGLQRFASDVLKYHISAVSGQNVRDGAVLVVDNRTGEILAYVANSGEISSGRHVDGIIARRQAGSTLKPFLYGIAFDRHILTPASIVMDSPLDISADRGIYRPDNYDNDFKGPVPARIALASSLNVPAVRTLSVVGRDAFIRKLTELGIKDLQSGEHYGYSIALGTADVTLYELVNAYRTLANRGIWSGLKIEPSGKGGKTHRVYSEEAAYLVSDILSDREARIITFGFENPLSTKFWTAVKTGTSKDMRDNWCIGYSERYTVGVWVGNFSGEPMWNVSGVTGAAPVWHEVMNYLHADKNSSPPKMPKGMVVQQTNVPEAGKTALFIKGTEPLAIRSETSDRTVTASAELVKITYPAEGMIIALDPDIPDDQQRVFFESSRADLNVCWQLNNESMGRTSEVVSWRPEPGKYALSLTDNEGRQMDMIHFVVRGNRI
jgi:penicillin-binding protein 1C